MTTRNNLAELWAAGKRNYPGGASGSNNRGLLLQSETSSALVPSLPFSILEKSCYVWLALWGSPSDPSRMGRATPHLDFPLKLSKVFIAFNFRCGHLPSIWCEIWLAKVSRKAAVFALNAACSRCLDRRRSASIEF